jgi:hypothetical protein
MGDFNFSEIEWDTWSSSASANHPSWNLIDCLQNNFLYQAVNCHTRFREGQKPSLLDLIITNEEGMAKDVEARCALGKSDHVVLSFSLQCYMEENSEIEKERFLFNKGDYESFEKDLNSDKWEEEMSNMNANNCWKLFANKIYEAMEVNIPKTKPRQERKPEKKTKPL